jgi:precorrin-2 dehydrogenase/sirohydrochlorin ferrochelatase
MAYLPIFININTAKILVVGGGAIATDKLDKLLNFTKEITVISSEVSEQAYTLIEDNALILHRHSYMKGDIEGFDIVIVATDTVELHQVIYQESRGSRILINSVDNTDYCDFIFPSFIQKGDLTVAFSTGGASPSFAKHMRSYYESSIPNSVVGFLEKMKSLRSTMPKGKERMVYFNNLVETYFKKNFK